MKNIQNTPWGEIKNPPLDIYSIQQTERLLLEIEYMSVDRPSQVPTDGTVDGRTEDGNAQRDAILQTNWAGLVKCQKQLLAKLVLE